MSADTGGNRLPVLAESIRQTANLVAEQSRSAADNALAAGFMLCEAKALCKHGEWLPFLAQTGVAERSAQRWMRLHRAGFTSATVADLGFSIADKHAAAGLGMIPRDGFATEASAWDEDGTAKGLFYWWQEGERVNYWGVHLLTDRAIAVEPRLMPVWLAGAVHAGERSRFDHYQERETPVAEARAFVASAKGASA